MTTYDDHNFPSDLSYAEPIDAGLTEHVRDILTAAAGRGDIIAEETRIVYVFDRKGELSSDDFAGPRNASYSGANDDIVVQRLYRIRNANASASVKTLKAIIKEDQKVAARAELQAKIAKCQADRAAADFELQRNIDALSALNAE